MGLVWLARVPDVQDDNPIEVLYKDEAQVASTVDALSAFLRLQSSVFSLVALELHVLTKIPGGWAVQSLNHRVPAFSRFRLVRQLDRQTRSDQVSSVESPRLHASLPIQIRDHR